jgi:hypothetical protein
MKVGDPERDLAELLERLVGGRRVRRKQPEAPTAEKLTRDLARRVQERELDSKVERNRRIHSDLLGRDLVFPFAYHNGATNLVQVVAFNAPTPDANIDRACPLVVEAQEVSKPRLKGHLHVVGAFRSDQPQTPQQVGRLLEAFKVCLHPWEQIEKFLDEVEQSAH